MHLQPQNRVAHFVRLALKGGVVATCLAFASAAQAGIAFQFNFSGAFTDGANNDAAQQGAMVTAGNLFSNMFGNYFSNSGTIVLNASGSDDPPEQYPGVGQLCSRRQWCGGACGFGCP